MESKKSQDGELNFSPQETGQLAATVLSLI